MANSRSSKKTMLGAHVNTELQDAVKRWQKKHNVPGKRPKNKTDFIIEASIAFLKKEGIHINEEAVWAEQQHNPALNDRGVAPPPRVEKSVSYTGKKPAVNLSGAGGAGSPGSREKFELAQRLARLGLDRHPETGTTSSATPPRGEFRPGSGMKQSL
jgi:hypothetical protein